MPDVHNYAKDAKTPLEYFLLFIDENILNDIVQHANQRIRILGKSLNYKDTLSVN